MRIKGWQEFQHFKDRRPPWIRLYRHLLDDPEWHKLRGDDAKLLIELWLLASEDKLKEGNLPDVANVAWRLRKAERTVNEAISRLSHWVDRRDIGVISERQQDDITRVSPEESRGEAETEKTSSPDGSVVPALAGPTPEHLFALWNERAHPNLPRCEILSDKRKSHARSRLRQYPDRPFWDRLMEKVNRSKFLTGEAGGQRPFKCTFDWILNETNLIKIIEGNYDGR